MAKAQSLDQLLTNEYGVNTHPEVNPMTSIAGVAATQIAPNNPNRVGFNIINLGANNVYVYIDNSVGTTKGFLLAANGGSLNLDWRVDFALISNEWWAIAVTAPSQLLVLGLVTL
jgi:hypothetical protein